MLHKCKIVQRYIFSQNTEFSFAKILISICGKLGFPSETVETVLSLVSDMIKLNNDGNKLTGVMSETKPVFVLK